MIDLHCHILPAIDDGSRSLEESLAMAETAIGDGIEIVVATPHMLNGVYRNTLETVQAGVSSLKTALADEGLPLHLRVGGDVHAVPGMVKAVEAGEAVTLNNGRKYLLMELPSQSIPPGIQEEIFQLRIHGITPIITHPERNPVIQRDLEVLRAIVAMGALVQVTAMSIAGDFGETVEAAARSLLESRIVHIIASDAHSQKDRPPILSRGVEAAGRILGSMEEAERMVTIIPAAILAGDSVEPPEPRPAKSRSRWTLANSSIFP